MDLSAPEDPTDQDYQHLLLNLFTDVGTVIANDKAGDLPTLGALPDDLSLLAGAPAGEADFPSSGGPSAHAAIGQAFDAAAPLAYHHEHRDSGASAAGEVLGLLSLQQPGAAAPPGMPLLQLHQQLQPLGACAQPQPAIGAPPPLGQVATTPLGADFAGPSSWHGDAAWPSGNMWAPAVPAMPPAPHGGGHQEHLVWPQAPVPTQHQSGAPSSTNQPAQLQSSHGSQHRPSQEGKEQAHTSGQRRKRPTSTQVVAELQAQVAQQVALAKQLSMNNIWLAERMRIMELVIAVRSAQMARLHEIRKGLDFNPFVGFRSNVQEMRDASPSKVADKLLELTGGMAMRLAAIQPLLQTNPHLLALSQPAGPVPPAHMVFEASRPLVAPPLPPLFDFTHAHMLPELQQLIVEIQRMQLTYSFLNLIHPHMLRVGNLNLQALQDSTVSWDSLVETMSAQATAPAAPGGLGHGQLPTIAPDVQWVKLAESLRLSDLQRLRAAALWDIISSARKSVLQQRAHLAAAVAQVLLQSQADTTLVGGAAPLASAQSSGASPAPPHSPPSTLHAPPPPPSGFHPALSASHSGSSSGHQQAGAGDHPGPTHSEALSGPAGAPLAPSGSLALGSSQGRLEGQVRAMLSKSPAALQQEAALMEKLQYNLIKERCLITIAAETMFRFIFSPVQNAVALVSAYPFVVDQMAVLHAAALEFQPAVLDRLVASMESSPGMALPALPSASGPVPVPPPPTATAPGAAGVAPPVGGQAERPTLSSSASRATNASRGADRSGSGAAATCLPSAAS